MQYALDANHHGRRDLCRKPRRLPRRERTRRLFESARSALPRRSATCSRRQATPANIAAAQAIVPDVRAAVCRISPAPSGRCCGRSRSTPAVTDVYGDVARSDVPLAAADRREAAVRRWADREFQLHVQPHRGQSRRADRLQLRSGLGRRRQRSAARLERDRSVYNLPFGAEGKPGSGNPVVRAIVKDWQVSGITQFRSGRPLGIDRRGVQPAERRERATPTSTPASRARSASTATTATATCSERRRPPTSIATRSSRRAAFTYGNTPRTLAFDLRNPSYFNQDLSVRRDFPDRQDEARARRRRVQRLQHGRVRRHPDQHHQRQLRPGELADQHAARRADQGAAGVLITGAGWRHSR